jgi:chaperonin GroES
MSKTKVNIHPLGSRILVRPDKDSERRTSAGLYVSETAKEKPQIGLVIAIGDDEENNKVTVSPSELFRKYTCTEIKLGGEDHLILESNDILAIVTK